MYYDFAFSALYWADCSNGCLSLGILLELIEGTCSILRIYTIERNHQFLQNIVAGLQMVDDFSSFESASKYRIPRSTFRATLETMSETFRIIYSEPECVRENPALICHRADDYRIVSVRAFLFLVYFSDVREIFIYDLKLQLDLGDAIGEAMASVQTGNIVNRVANREIGQNGGWMQKCSRKSRELIYMLAACRIVCLGMFFNRFCLEKMLLKACFDQKLLQRLIWPELDKLYVLLYKTILKQELTSFFNDSSDQDDEDEYELSSTSKFLSPIKRFVCLPQESSDESASMAGEEMDE